MTERNARRWIFFLFLLVAASAAAALLFYRNFASQFRRGNLIQLIDLIPHDSSQPSGAVRQRAELLTGRWIRLATLNNQTAVWKTSTQFSIADTSEPVVFKDHSPLVRKEDVFGADAAPGEWTFYGQTLWITTSLTQDPLGGGYSITYDVLPQATLVSRTETLLKRTAVSGGVLVYHTTRPVFSCADKAISISDERHQPISDWRHNEASKFVALNSGTDSPYSMRSNHDSFANTRFYTAGPVQWTFLAAGSFSHNPRPRMAIFLDDQMLKPVLFMRSRNFESYSMQRIVKEGFHTMRVQFLNSDADRDIQLLRIEISSPEALLLNSAQHQYSIQYCTPDVEHAFAARTDVKGDVRASLIFSPVSKAAFRLKVPADGHLMFGVTAVSGAKRDRESMRLSISADPVFGPISNVFSATVDAKPGWKEQDVDLRKFSNRFILLQFETAPMQHSAGAFTRFAVSNPVLYSQSNVPKLEPRNIFIITADALRADHLRCYGYDRPTSPNIDQFAQDAVLFENAISQGAATLPSTSSLFTAVYPSMHQTDVNNSKLPGRFLTLPEIAKARGYMTAGFIQNEFLNPAHGLTDGFLWYDYDTLGRRTEERMQKVLNWIERMRAFPTFLFFHMLHPHSPYIPPAEFAQKLNAVPNALASSNQKLLEINDNNITLPERDRRELIALYDAEILHVDSLFGQLIGRLKRLGLYEDSMIIFLSDHGEGFQEHGSLLHGSSVYQNMIHVPLIVKLPAKFAAKGIRVRDYVETMDLMPTILEITNARVPASVEGKSLLSLIKNGGRTTNSSRPVYSEVLSGKMLCVIRNGYKYIYTGNSGKEELYDLRSDPQEAHDLSPMRPELMAAFRQDRMRFFNKTLEWRQKYVVKGERIHLDESQNEQLRALGYVH